MMVICVIYKCIRQSKGGPPVFTMRSFLKRKKKKKGQQQQHQMMIRNYLFYQMGVYFKRSNYKCLVFGF